MLFIPKEKMFHQCIRNIFRSHRRDRPKYHHLKSINQKQSYRNLLLLIIELSIIADYHLGI